MSKKNERITPDISALLGGRKKAVKAEKLSYQDDTNITNINDKTNLTEATIINESTKYTRATFMIKSSYNEGLRDLAWYKRSTIKEVLEEALKDYFIKHSEELVKASAEKYHQNKNSL